METCVAAHRECLRPSMSDEPPPSIPQAAPTPLRTEPAGLRAQRKKAAHALVQELLAQGRSRRAIARHLGWGLNTVLRYASAARWQDTLRDNRPRPSRLDPHMPHLDRWFTEGCTSVTQLHRELVTQGARVTYGMVRAYIAVVYRRTRRPRHRRCGR
ncbi:hypothetical protein ACFVH0_32525 [Streptomyces sp. NPDC127117]|uniref:hypothetical protein n=1 Tax=Streptomyces sp. NPDC127117 TaxID=3345368 RepID=UPI0036320F4D